MVDQAGSVAGHVVLVSSEPEGAGGIAAYVDGLGAIAHLAGWSSQLLPLGRDGREASSAPSLRSVRLVARAMRDRPDSVVVYSSWIAARAAGFWGARGRTCVIVHGLEAGRLLGTDVTAKVTRFAIDRRMRVVFNSASTRALTLEQGWRPRDSVVFHPPVAGSSAPVHPPVSHVAFVGRLVERKGAMALVRAWKTVHAELGLTLVIVGDGPDHASIEGEIRRCGLDDIITIEPDADDARRDEIVAGATALCMLNSPPGDPFDVEGYGMVFVEAGMMGVATVGVDLAGATEAIEHAGGTSLQPDWNERDLVAALADARHESLATREQRAGLVRSRWSLVRRTEEFTRLVSHD